MIETSQMPPRVAVQLRILQVLASALILGVVFFAMIATFIHMNADPDASPQMESVLLMRIAAAGLGMINLFLAIGFSMLTVNVAARSIGSGAEATYEELFGRFFIMTIVALALLEGAALFATVIYFLGGELIDLGIAAIPVVFMIVLFFPTEGRLRRFVESVSARAAARP